MKIASPDWFSPPPWWNGWRGGSQDPGRSRGRSPCASWTCPWWLPWRRWPRCRSGRRWWRGEGRVGSLLWDLPSLLPPCLTFSLWLDRELAWSLFDSHFLFDSLWKTFTISLLLSWVYILLKTLADSLYKEHKFSQPNLFWRLKAAKTMFKYIYSHGLLHMCWERKCYIMIVTF